MYCSKCGNKNQKDSLFCGNCGTELKAAGDKTKEPTEFVQPEISSDTLKPNEFYANFWIRLLAYFVDIGFAIFFSFFFGYVAANLFGDIVIVIEIINLTSENILGYFMSVVYGTIALALFSTTPGKAIYGLRVQDKDTGEKVSFKVALFRPILQILSTFLWGCGYWNMGKNAFLQAWHDKKMNTVVVGKKKKLVVSIAVSILVLIISFYFINNL